MENINRLVLIDSDTFESTKNDLDDGINLAVLTAPIELCIWDDLCVFGNQIIEALNEIRDLLSINLVDFILFIKSKKIIVKFNLRHDKNIFAKFIQMLGWICE